MFSQRGLLVLVPVIFLGASARLSAGSPAAPAGSLPQESSPSGVRVVIRGSGSNVRLERETTALPTRRGASAASAPILDDVDRMTKSGVSDPLLLSYLKAHAGELPEVMAADVLARLQQRGVSETVLGFLGRRVAIDIGVTGEGREGSVVYIPAETICPPATDAGLAYDTGGYVSYGGYQPVFRRFSKSHRMLPRHPSMPFPFPSPTGPLVSPQPVRVHAAVSRPIVTPPMAGRRLEGN